MMEVAVTAGAIRRAKLQRNRHHQQRPTNTGFFFTGRMSFLSPNQQCQSTEGKRLNESGYLSSVGVFHPDSLSVNVRQYHCLID